MPEADLPGNQPPRFLTIESDASVLPPATPSSLTDVAKNAGESKDPAAKLATSQATLPEQPEEEWETVNFPNAISVDAIPTKSVKGGKLKKETGELSARAIPTDSPSPISPWTVRDRDRTIHFSPETPSKAESPTTLVQALHECNRDLMQRIAELETALIESQNALEAKETLLEQRIAELGDAQEQITKLFGKQEQVNQIIQRQEVLIETLTAQVQSSQTRIAVIERECALTQQRYSEQQHLVVQTENSCRELRSRLHRQQRHTLQFKAALERYLEMPHPIKSEVKTQRSESADDHTPTSSEVVMATLKGQNTEVQLKPQASPVKPWSGKPESIPEKPALEEPKAPSFPQENPIVSTLLEASSNQLHEVETYWHIEPTTENPFVSAEAEPELEDTPNPNEWEAFRASPFSDSAETRLPENPQWTAEPIFVGKADWVASITYSPGPGKKRRSLAEIELPRFR